MRIKNISFPNSITSKVGLSNIKMKGLGNLVLIAGKNGSGKSRLLNLLKENDLISQSVETDEKNRVLENLKTTRLALAQVKRTIDDYISRGLSNLNNNELSDYSFLEEKRKDFENEIRENEEFLKVEALEFEIGLPRSEIFEFVPKYVQLKDPDSLTKSELKSCLYLEKSLHINKVSELSFGVLQALQDYVTNNTVVTELNKNFHYQLIEKYDSLKVLVKEFLGTEIERNSFGDALIFSQPLGDSKLSEGQKVLFQLCIALLENNISIKDAILILDEPENHLHPQILVEIIDKIIKLNSFGQVWIATHSIPLIAHFDPSSLWLMDNNTITFSGRSPESVINSLVGELEKARLSEFLNLPAVFASIKFATECLMDALILDTSLNDPQTNQIHKIIRNLSKSKNSISLLDYGAGSGRLLKLITHYEDQFSSSLDLIDQRKIDYYAYDIPEVNQEFKSECLDTIHKYFYKKQGANVKRYFTSVADMALMKESTLDLIVMCNVFHEIDPLSWIGLFSRSEVIIKYLKEDGCLLIVEDHQMPIGEKAYRNGFMVFGEMQFRLLFQISENEEYIVNDSRGDGRLLAHLIPKMYLRRISHDNIIKAIKSLKQEALNNIDRIRRNEKPTFKSGMKLGFWLNQYANSSLNLHLFDKSS
ncbi:MAG TPA: AAA family ATPase [Chitinophagaceae bacterium]|nr:AAA family ATPase [Chitinophagaceae bacterium]HPH31902.1 AAA family ATPase [Chitinophagaceae bacterium]